MSPDAAGTRNEPMSAHTSLHIGGPADFFVRIVSQRDLDGAVSVARAAELPIFMLALVRLGVLSTDTLRSNRRLGYFIVAVVAVLLPGIDPVTTTLEAVPLIVLYELSIWLAVLVERRASQPEPASLTDP